MVLIIQGQPKREYTTCPKCGWKTWYRYNKPTGTQNDVDDLEPAGWRCMHCKHQEIL